MKEQERTKVIAALARYETISIRETPTGVTIKASNPKER